MPRRPSCAAPLEIQFLFPIAAAAPIPRITDGYARDLEKRRADISIKPVYAGSYDDTIAKAITAFKGGHASPLAMLGAIQVWPLIALDAIVPIDELSTSAEDKQWMNGFFPAFLANGNVQGHTWSIPFRRSTPVLFWNKDAFQEAGPDPEKPPQTWAEQTATGKKLVVKGADTLCRWGVRIPGTASTEWLYQGLAEQAGQQPMSPDGTGTFFNATGSADALAYRVSLGKQGIQPPMWSAGIARRTTSSPAAWRRCGPPQTI